MVFQYVFQLAFTSLVLAVLDRRCCGDFSPVAASGGDSPVAGHRLSPQWPLLLWMRALSVWASAVVSHGLSSCGSQALEHSAVAHKLGCSPARGIFPDQGSNTISCISRQILYHSVTREAPTECLIHLNTMSIFK